MDNSSFEPSVHSEITKCSSNQPSTSTCIPSFAKVTMEEQNKRNGDKMAKSNGHVFPIVLATIAVVLLVFSNIAVLFFTVRVATDVKEVKERVDRLPNGNSSDNLTTNTTSEVEISSYKQDTTLSKLQKNVEDGLKVAVDIIQTSLTDAEKSFTSAIDICNNDQEMNISRSSNSIDTVLNTTFSLLQEHTQDYTKEYVMGAMLNVTNTVHGLSERIDQVNQAMNYRDRTLQLCLKDGSCHYVLRSPTRHICFKMSTEKAGWFEAKQRCESLGGYLAEVTNFIIQEFVLYFVSQMVHKTFWLGGTDRLHEGHWLWANSSDEVDFTDWLVGEPNNYNNSEHCMTLVYPRVGGWNDVPCTNSEYFLCMKSGMTDCEHEPW